MKRWFTLLMLFGMCISSIACSNKTIQPKDDTVTIYVARHGKTLLNSYIRVQGIIDSPLTAEGRQTAKYLGAGLDGIHFDEFYTSDLGRQKETMQIIKQQISQSEAPVIEDKRLQEVFLGGFEGNYDDEMFKAAAKYLKLKGGVEQFKKMRNNGSLDLPTYLNAIANADPTKTAENYEQVKNRTQASLQNMVKNALEKGDKTILAVSSGTAIQIMISDLTTDPDRNKPLVNAAVVKIVYHNGKYNVEEIGSDKYIKLGMSRLGVH